MDGFTLMEVLVAIALTGVALSGVAMTGVITMHADTKSNQASAATTLAQAQLEQMRTLARADAGWDDGVHPEEEIDENGAPDPEGRYTRQWTVEQDYNDQAGLARVTVIVAWGEEPQQSVTLSSLYW